MDLFAVHFYLRNLNYIYAKCGFVSNADKSIKNANRPNLAFVQRFGLLIVIIKLK